MSKCKRSSASSDYPIPMMCLERAVGYVIASVLLIAGWEALLSMLAARERHWVALTSTLPELALLPGAEADYCRRGSRIA